jgi:hypothetical protein
MQHHHPNSVQPFGPRLSEEAGRLRERAKTVPPGIKRDELLRKARQADTAAHIDEWLSSRANCSRQGDRNRHTEIGVDQNNTRTQSRYAAFWERHMGDPQQRLTLAKQGRLDVAQ